jgi:hypothetical protein
VKRWTRRCDGTYRRGGTGQGEARWPDEWFIAFTWKRPCLRAKGEAQTQGRASRAYKTQDALGVTMVPNTQDSKYAGRQHVEPMADCCIHWIHNVQELVVWIHARQSRNALQQTHGSAFPAWIPLNWLTQICFG